MRLEGYFQWTKNLPEDVASARLSLQAVNVSFPKTKTPTTTITLYSNLVSILLN